MMIYSIFLIKEIKKMADVKIVYWSGTGNTAAMAEAVAEGITAAGGNPVYVPVGQANAEEIASEKAFAMGCPSMGAEQLEESEMQPFEDELVPLVSGKKILIFGSYGWGDGEWMRNWAEELKGAGAELIEDEGIIANEAPDDDAKAALVEAGKALAAAAE